MKLKKIIAIGLLTVTLTGCSEDFLETSPSQQVGQKEAENTVAGLEGIINGIHSMMYRYSFAQPNGNGHQSMSAQYDMLGDDMINTRPAFHMGIYRYTATVNVTDNSDINYRAWDFYYTVIQHANKVIDGVKKSEGLTSGQKNSLLGEAHAFRAWSYHYLVQLFGKRYVKGDTNNSLGVIIRTPENFDDPLPRSTVAQVYEVIDSDIQLALENLEQATDKKIKNTIRYATACGIAARIALTKSDWENAEKYAKLAIEKSDAALQSGNSLLDGFNNYNASEWMWGYSQTSEQNLFYAHFNADYSYNFAGSNRSLRFAVNRDIYDEMGVKDVRRKWWVCLDQGDVIPSDADSQYFAGGTNNNPSWEITGQHIKFKAQSKTDSSGNTLMMRLAEMYYILAEAQARQDKDMDAQNTLNLIMKTRDVDYSTSLTGTQLIDEVMRNKRIDLWMEGQRFFDMKRLGVISNRLNSKNLQVYLTGTAKTTAITRNSGNNAVNIPTTIDSKYWQFAIPFAEISSNPLCQQNEL